MKTLYPSYGESVLDSSAPNLSSGDVKVAALSSTYVYNAAHNRYDDLSGVIANSGNLGSKSIAGGVFDAANNSFGSPAGGSTIVALVAYRDSGTPSTSELIAYTDEDPGGSPIEIETDGNEIFLNFPVEGLFGLVAT